MKSFRMNHLKEIFDIRGMLLTISLISGRNCDPAIVIRTRVLSLIAA